MWKIPIKEELGTSPLRYKHVIWGVPTGSVWVNGFICVTAGSKSLKKGNPGKFSWMQTTCILMSYSDLWVCWFVCLFGVFVLFCFL